MDGGIHIGWVPSEGGKPARSAREGLAPRPEEEWESSVAADLPGASSDSSDRPRERTSRSGAEDRFYSAAGKSGVLGIARFRPGSVVPLIDHSGLHGMFFAPTGAGKGVSFVVPLLLQAPAATTVVIDVKGENRSVAADRRRKLGHTVVRLAPFSDDATDSLNPLDILALPDADLEHDAESLCHLVGEHAGGAGGRRAISSDPFWDNNGRALLKGVMLAAVSCLPREERTIGKIYDLLHTDDVVYNLAVLLDTKGASARSVASGEASSKPDGPAAGGRIHPSAHREISAFLQMPEVTRGGVLATAQSYLKLFAGAGVRRSLSATSFDLKAFIASAPMTVFIEFPPERLSSHAPVLRLWISTLLRCIFSRRTLPARPTMLLLDEVAQLGRLDELEKAVTLGRGYGLRCMMFFQDANQLRRIYPDSWLSMYNNCGVVSCFGARNPLMRNDFAEILGVDRRAFESLAPDEHIVLVDGEPRRAWRPDYLRDSAYAGLFSPNPFYGDASASARRRRRREEPGL